MRRISAAQCNSQRWRKSRPAKRRTSKPISRSWQRSPEKSDGDDGKSAPEARSGSTYVHRGWRGSQAKIFVAGPAEGERGKPITEEEETPRSRKRPARQQRGPNGWRKERPQIGRRRGVERGRLRASCGAPGASCEFSRVRRAGQPRAGGNGRAEQSVPDAPHGAVWNGEGQDPFRRREEKADALYRHQSGPVRQGRGAFVREAETAIH